MAEKKAKDTQKPARSTPKADSDEKPGKSDHEKHEKGEKSQGKN